MRLALLSIWLALPLAFVGCAASNPTTASTPGPPQSSLQIVTNAELTLAQSVGALQTAVISANQTLDNSKPPQKLISDQATSDILGITDKIALAGQQADAVTRGLAALTPSNKTNLAAIFNPILIAVNNSLSNGLVMIKDPNTVNTIRLLLTTIQATLSGVQLALAGSN